MCDILLPCVLWSGKHKEVALEEFLSAFVVNVHDCLREQRGAVPMILLVPKHCKTLQF